MECTELVEPFGLSRIPKSRQKLASEPAAAKAYS
jgi:hypothetical protein